MAESWENGKYVFKEGFEKASPEVKAYYRKMVSMFVQATMEIGYKNALILVKETLADNLATQEASVANAREALTNTREAIREIESI